MLYENKDIDNRIEEILKELRPYLILDGGDIEYLHLEKGFIKDKEVIFAIFKFLGNCFDCPLNQMTLRGGIERYIKKYIPEIYRIELGK